MPAVEDYGVEPVPPEERTTGWPDLFAIMLGFNLNPLVYVLGALAVTVGGLPLWWAAAAIGGGVLVANVMLTVAARAGVDDGLSGQVAMRATFGQWGARGLTSPYRVAASAYWFAAQALAGALAFQALVLSLTGDELRLVPVALALAAASAVLAAVGFDALRYFVRVVLPLGVGFLAVIVTLFLTAGDPAFSPSRVLDSPGSSLTWLGLATFFSAMAGAQLSVVTNVADISRYARSRADVRIGLLGGSTIGAFAGAWVGAYSATASGEVNPFLAAAHLTGSEVVLVALLVALLVQTVSVNVINVYTGGLSLVNTLPRLGRFAATAVVGAVSVALAAFPDFIDSAQVWFVRLGNVAGPITGVLLVDFLLLQGGRIDVRELFRPDGRYRYRGGLNLRAALAVAAGVATSFAVPESWVKIAWGVGVAAGAYLLLVAFGRAEPARPWGAAGSLRGQTDRAPGTS